MIRYLTAEQVLFIHARLIDETGGLHGVRDLGMVQSTIARPQATFDGADLYPDIFSKAAALMDSLVNNHPFVDGNKRTGIAATGLFLRFSGIHLTATNPELAAFTLAVAQSKMSLESITAWLQSHSELE